MEKRESVFNKPWFKGLAVIIVFLVAFFAKQFFEEQYLKMSSIGSGSVTFYDGQGRVGRELNYAENVSEDNLILSAFKEAFPNTTVLLACEEDLTDDGNKDLVIIYNTAEEDQYIEKSTKIDGGYVRLTVAIDTGDGEHYEFSDPIPAPIENQRIKFQNVDKTDEIEFILQGQKGAKVGYGIYRVMNGEPINLFGEGLEEC